MSGLTDARALAESWRRVAAGDRRDGDEFTANRVEACAEALEKLAARLRGDGEQVAAGCILVEEASCVPHVHPQYGSGLFFTEDAALSTQPAPSEQVAASVAVPEGKIRLFGRIFDEEVVRTALLGLAADLAAAPVAPGGAK